MVDLSVNGSQKWGTRGTAGATIAGQLKFDRVAFVVPNRKILDQISFELAPGEIVSFLGPSGCGKTSLLRLAAGVSQPSEGSIIIDQDEVSGPHRFVVPERRNVGLMFQDFVLFPHMTVLQNVKYGLRGWSDKDAEDAARRGLARVGMEAAAQQYPYQLSGGEQQRVALARAIVPRPQILLMDEPFSGLDQRLRDAVRGETMALLREMRATSILVTHDPQEAMEVSDRIFLMRAGRIIQSGTPETMFESPIDPEAALFFSDGNQFVGTVKSGQVDTVLGRFPASGFVEGTQALVIIRPQLIELAEGRLGHEAFVKDVQFRGSAKLLTLIFQGAEKEMFALIGDRAVPKKGELARFAVNMSRRNNGVLVFKKP